MEHEISHRNCVSQGDLIGCTFGLAFIMLVMFGGTLAAVALHSESPSAVQAKYLKLSGFDCEKTTKHEWTCENLHYAE